MVLSNGTLTTYVDGDMRSETTERRPEHMGMSFEEGKYKPTAHGGGTNSNGPFKGLTDLLIQQSKVAKKTSPIKNRPNYSDKGQGV